MDCINNSICHKGWLLQGTNSRKQEMVAICKINKHFTATATFNTAIIHLSQILLTVLSESTVCLS